MPLQATENKWSRAQPHFLSLTCRREHKVPSSRSCALPHTRGESSRPEVNATTQDTNLEDHGHANAGVLLVLDELVVELFDLFRGGGIR